MSDCLILNQDYSPISVLPLSVISWQRAITLVYLQKLKVLEVYADRFVRSERLTLNVPAVCVTSEYFNHKRNIRFSRHNVYLRDLFQCQYCGDTFDYEDLTIDHVIPRVSGGKTTWTNIVSACYDCNSAKGNKLMKPLNHPYKPDYYSLLGKWKNIPFNVKHDSWYTYLGIDRQAANG
jgi:5-methylcytosine-specific restriction endonuclease McrA